MAVLYSRASRSAQGATESRPNMVSRNDHVDELSQATFPVLQAVSMDRHISSGFEIPAASFSTFLVVAVILWVILYDRVFLPLASRLMGRPVCLSTIQRMGIGILLSFLAMIVSAMVEAVRRSLATEQASSEAVMSMSASNAIAQPPRSRSTSLTPKKHVEHSHQ